MALNGKSEKNSSLPLFKTCRNSKIEIEFGLVFCAITDMNHIIFIIACLLDVLLSHK